LQQAKVWDQSGFIPDKNLVHQSKLVLSNMGIEKMSLFDKWEKSPDSLRLKSTNPVHNFKKGDIMMRNIAFTLIFGLGIMFMHGCDEMSPVSSGQELLNRSADATSASVHQAVRHAAGGFEVWAVDQSNSAGLDYGGAIHIFEGAALMGESASEKEPLAVLDLAEATTDLCQASTGANPVRPHMLLFNSANTHAILSFVVSGHVVIYDAENREPLRCFRMSEGAGGAIQAHAAFPSPDDSYILVANQNGKLLERIDTDYTSNSFTHNTDATLNLAEGQTPNGEDREDPDLRPDNAPICPIIDSSSKYGFVTLRGGGLFIAARRGRASATSRGRVTWFLGRVTARRRPAFVSLMPAGLLWGRARAFPASDTSPRVGRINFPSRTKRRFRTSEEQ
jgi:hypothetical protein